MTNFIFIKIVITLDFSCGDPISKNISTNPLNNHFINFFHIRIMDNINNLFHLPH